MKQLLIFMACLAVQLIFSSCGDTGSAQKLQSHLAAAATNSQQISTHAQETKSHLETADYKGSRAKKLLDQGVEQ